MTAVALDRHNPDAALPTLGDVFNYTVGPATTAVAARAGDMRRHLAEVLITQSATWMRIFETEFPTIAHGLGDSDLPAHRIDHVTRAELRSIPDLGMATRSVRLPPPID